nr:hypothetical protein Iba_chr14aCG6690 [Ipomoea batatas]
MAAAARCYTAKEKGTPPTKLTTAVRFSVPAAVYFLSVAAATPMTLIVAAKACRRPRRRTKDVATLLLPEAEVKELSLFRVAPKSMSATF